MTFLDLKYGIHFWESYIYIFYRTILGATLYKLKDLTHLDRGGGTLWKHFVQNDISFFLLEGKYIVKKSQSNFWHWYRNCLLQKNANLTEKWRFSKSTWTLSVNFQGQRNFQHLLPYFLQIKSTKNGSKNVSPRTGWRSIRLPCQTVRQ